MLVALNGVNGNVAGSYKALKRRDSAVFIFEGADLEESAKASGETSRPRLRSRSRRAQFP